MDYGQDVAYGLHAVNGLDVAYGLHLVYGLVVVYGLDMVYGLYLVYGPEGSPTSCRFEVGYHHQLSDRFPRDIL